MILDAFVTSCHHQLQLLWLILFVSSKLDYCNSLYFGISTKNLSKLQRIQNSLARAITFTSKRQHISPVLKDLHWLPVKERIDFKICLLTYKSLKNHQPVYLHETLSIPSHSIFTRSSQSRALSKHVTHTNAGSRAFSVAAPKLWNLLPPSIRTAPSIPTFRSRLKTHLFRQAYPP